MNNGRGYDHNPDIPDFGTRRDMDDIRKNEDLERRIRQKRVAEIQRQERIKQLKIQQLKQTVTAWAILLFIVIAIIAIITGIFSSGKDKNNRDNDTVGIEVSDEQKQLISDFTQVSYSFFGTEELENLNSFVTDNSSIIESYLNYPSYFTVLSESIPFAGGEQLSNLKNAVRDCAIFSNGYIWSSKDSMKYPVTDGYLYDTNASFITAVYDICRWSGNTDFLYEKDTTTTGAKDFSNGMTVLQKLENASEYFFDKDDLNGGGIRYNEQDGLCYILTSENSGNSGGKPSNIFHNHSFGYLDLYNNILFNRAMVSLEALYTSLEDAEKAAFYSSISQANKDAINKKFWNNNLNRYVGYIDKNGNVHDLGYTAINLYAISSDIADKNKSEKILSWIDGERKINTDTLSYEKVYKSAQLPAFTTIAASDEVWFDKDGSYPYSGAANFGKYWQNGGISFASAFYNIQARSKVSSNKVLSNSISKTVDATSSVSFGKGEDIFAVCSAYLSSKELFGVDVENNILYIDPLFSSNESYGLKNLTFSGNRYGLLYKKSKLYITADLNMAVRIKVAAPKDGSSYTLYVVEEGKIVSKEAAPVGKDGFVDVYKRFGATSYVLLEKNIPEKK